MRMLVGLLILIALFALLVRLLPPGWGLPLYMLFVALGIGFVILERRRIDARRRSLERELNREQPSWQQHLKERGHDAEADEG